MARGGWGDLLAEAGIGEPTLARMAMLRALRTGRFQAHGSQERFALHYGEALGREIGATARDVHRADNGRRHG